MQIVPPHRWNGRGLTPRNEVSMRADSKPTWRVIEGDCRDVLPTVEASVLVADPPYGTGYYPSDTSLVTGPVLQGWVERFEAVAVFGWPERLAALCAATGLVPDEWITWWPTNARYRGFNRAGLWREVECIAVFGAGDWSQLRQPRVETTTPFPDPGRRGKALDPRGARMGDVWRDESPNLNPNQPRRLHPNEKPVPLLRRLLTALPPGTVVDPCAGSGSTLVAAVDECRDSIGVEIDPRYVALARDRLSGSLLSEAA